ncbi:nucleotide exchange factor GrpE [Maricaulis sp. CAU 1757]
MSDTENKTEDELDAGAPKNPESAAAAEPKQAEAGSDISDLADAGPALIEQLKAEIAGLQEDKLRALADAQNTRRRAEKEVADARAYSVSSFAKDLLDVADSLSRAVSALDENELNGAPQTIKNLVDGVAMTEKALLSKLERHGIKKVDPQPGDAFDPHVHQAVAQIPSEQANGKIAAVMQTGYVLKERTLRAAMVAVSSGQAAAGGDDGPSTGGSVDVKA